MERFNWKKLNNVEMKEQHQVRVLIICGSGKLA
jgi:hypothetical protein